jgi:transketolase
MALGPSEGPEVPVPFGGVPGPEIPLERTGGAYNGPVRAELDRFVFSPVHYALVLYALLIEVGRLGDQALRTFNQDGSTVELIGAEHSPGHEVTAGSLGQALSQAGGLALGRRLRERQTGHRETGRVWVFMSDGEFQEGQTWEACGALSFHQLDNLGVYVDVNGQQCDGLTAETMTVAPLADRLRSFGCAVREVDGHDVEALAEAAPAVQGQPLFVLARTDPCRGLPLLEQRAPKLHYVRFRNADEQAAYEQVLAAMTAGEEPTR